MTEISQETRKFSLEKQDNIAVLTIKTSEKINQFSIEALNELSSILDEINKDASISILIFTGNGKAFVAGADIKQMINMGQFEAEEFSKLGQSVFNKVDSLKCITIAAINGVAVGGGCELSLACDYRIAVEEAKLGQPEISIGAIPGWGGCYRLPRLVGYNNARDMFLTGKLIDTQEALKIGLIDKITTQENLLNSANELSKELLQKSPLILKFAKEALKAGITLDKDSADRKEQILFGLSFASEDRKEGMQAFIEKRKPEFKGI